MIRSDIAALVLAGHTDDHIARRLGCHRATANRHRRALLRPVTAEERLLAEELPTVRVRDYDRRREPITPERAAANRAALAAALRRPARLSARPATEEAA